MYGQTRVMVVEDDLTLREAICDTLNFSGVETFHASNGAEALECLKHTPVDLLISDIQMDVMDGFELLQRVKKLNPNLPVVMITAHGAVEGAVQAMRFGASDYLQKPFQAEVLLDMVERFMPLPENDEADKTLIAEDEQTQRAVRIAERVAETDATVLISGESGTGKEVIAQLIHARSARATKPFIAVNCAAIPENMLESMLFGYEKGAYTGAHQSRAGKFEQANGGTILLDEISEMELGLQAKLLRVLQEREVERLGSNKLIPLDVRVIATTNRNLREEVNESRFREDLFYRLSVFPMKLPALRERPADIAPLAKFALSRQTFGGHLGLTADAIAKLESYSWPGNVRELENCIQRATILSNGQEINAFDIDFESDTELAGEPATRNTDAKVENTTNAIDQGLLNGNLKATENQTILATLTAVNGSRKAAAEKLGISPRTLRYKLARLKDQGTCVPVVAR